MTIYCKISKNEKIEKKGKKNKNSWYYFFIKRMIGPSCTWHFLWLSASLCWFLVPNLGEMPDFVYPHEVKDQIFPISLCLFFWSMFIIPFLKVISELRYFCFNAFYNVTVLHYNSILWEELLRNKKKPPMWVDCALSHRLCLCLSLYLCLGWL